MRTQVHSCGAPDNVQEEVCGSGGDYETWGEWSPCSQSCAGGFNSKYIYNMFLHHTVSIKRYIFFKL